MAAQDQITLHWLNGSRSQRIVWLLGELNVPYELKIYHRTSTMRAPPELEAISPLGKSPVLTIVPAGAPPGTKPTVLMESGFIVEYLCEHYAQGTSLVPPHWQPGQEGRLLGETPAYLRFRYLLHYAEGTLAALMVFAFLVGRVKTPDAPAAVQGVADGLIGGYAGPNILQNLAMVDGLLAEPPAGAGQGFLCGGHLTAADILLSFPLLSFQASDRRPGALTGGSFATRFPALDAYLVRLVQEPGYRKAVAVIEKADGQAYALL